MRRSHQDNMFLIILKGDDRVVHFTVGDKLGFHFLPSPLVSSHVPCLNNLPAATVASYSFLCPLYSSPLFPVYYAPTKTYLDPIFEWSKLMKKLLKLVLCFLLPPWQAFMDPNCQFVQLYILCLLCISPF